MKDAKVYRFFSLSVEYGFYGLLFSLPISVALVESFACLLLFGFIGRKIIKPDFKYLKFRPNIFLLFLLLFSAISMFNSGHYLSKSLNALFGKWVQYLGICIIVQDIVSDKKIFKRGMLVFLLGALLAVFSGLSQYFFEVEFLRHKSIAVTNMGMRAITSSFAHYNGFGAYLVVVLSLLFSLLLSKLSRFKTYSLTIVTMLSIVAIFFTLSRGSWIALIVSFILLAILARSNFKRLVPILLLIIVMFLLPVFRGRLLFIFKEGGDSDRFRYWLAAWKMINEHPFFGMGVGTFMANFSKFLPDSNISYAHNCYLQIWAETGIFSLISFMVFIFSLVYLSIKKFFAAQDFLLLGLLIGMVGFLVHSFFEVNFYSVQLAVLFWAWVGLVISRIQNE